MDLAERQQLLEELAKEVITVEEYRLIVHPDLELWSLKRRNAFVESELHATQVKLYAAENRLREIAAAPQEA